MVDRPVKAKGKSCLEPSISVIIPHFNDVENLDCCLSHLECQSLSRDLFEVIVADNNSDCGVQKIRDVAANRARVILAPIQGAPAARNAAVSEARGEILAFTDSDCRPLAHWLEHGIELLRYADMVGGDVLIFAQDEDNPTAVEAFEKIFAFNCKRYVEHEGFSVTANMFVPRKIFERVGQFRSGVSEDKDWGQRATAQGYRWIYAARCQVLHPARRDWPALRQKWARLMYEMYGLAKQRPFGRIRWLLRGPVIFLSPLFHAIEIWRVPTIQLKNEKLQILFILCRVRVWRFIETYRLFVRDVDLRWWS